jgi:hypothetical protein
MQIEGQRNTRTYRFLYGFPSNAIGVTEMTPCFRGVLAVVCVLIAAGSCYELLLSRSEDNNNHTSGTVLPNHKDKMSLGKSNYSRRMKAKARLI